MKQQDNGEYFYEIKKTHWLRLSVLILENNHLQTKDSHKSLYIIRT